MRNYNFYTVIKMARYGISCRCKKISQYPFVLVTVYTLFIFIQLLAGLLGGEKTFTQHTEHCHSLLFTCDTLFSTEVKY
jgi:hypothetical protein